MSRQFPLPHQGAPRVHLLGNREHALHVFSDGSRALHWAGKAVNRWQAGRMPAATDVLLRDLDHDDFISASGQTCGRDAAASETLFDTGTACFKRQFKGFSSRLTLMIDPVHGGELALLELENHGSRPCRLEAVSTMELVLGDARADASHPAFSKMFVVTETLDAGAALLAHRRPRGDDEAVSWAAHGCRVEGVAIEASGFETDRMALLGRNRSWRDPARFDVNAVPAGRSGVVLDPVFCLSRRFALAPGARARLAFHTIAGSQREAVIKALAAALNSDSATTLTAAAHADASIESAFAAAANELGSALCHADNHWCAAAEVRRRGRGGQPALWPYAISGDRPIVQLSVSSPDQLGLLDDLLSAQQWWQSRQLAADLVVIHADALAPEVAERIRATGPAKDSGTAVFTLAASKLDARGGDVIATAAAAVLDGAAGSLIEQVRRRATPAAAILPPSPRPVAEATPMAATARPTRLADNGIGGFSTDGREYLIDLDGAIDTPAPWVNVMANPAFGAIVSANGGGYAFAVNSQQNTLTPWRNDAVSDAPGDVIYLRDAASGALWCPTPSPIRDRLGCRVAHGQGYSRFERNAHGIRSELTVFVTTEDPLRVSRLQLHNLTDTPRTLDVTVMAEWSMEAIGRDGRVHTACWRDPESGALFARNAWRTDFAERVAFLDLPGADDYSCDRAAFLGPRRDPAAPAALAVPPALDRREGIGLDPAAIQSRRIELAPGARVEVVVLLGQGADEVQSRALVTRYRAADLDAALAAVQAQWNAISDAVQVETPDPAIDVLVNRWLPYQVLSCRVWARAASYQASGAFGFRDQLQDVMALCLSRPDLARAHILRSAARQFSAGDVQHWWLPPAGAGVRTRIVDDRVWLPYVTAHYVRVSGDTAILDEAVPFLDAPELTPEQVDSFMVPATSKESASLFEHCARALEISFSTGEHGLPLFGRGDWNDGMNHVGKDGKGESVWMAWFLIRAIRDFLPLAHNRGEAARAQAWRDHAEALAQAAGAHAWDGAWWTRGWYDNGHPLGVAASTECRIDTIAQSWSVLSGAADRVRAAHAMESVDQLAVRRDADLIALFAPAFDQSPEDPGYIKGYPPGLRENGGQYTHGVIWSAIAFAELGDGDKAGELLAMLNPVHHGDSADKIARYKVEPYVSCADLYTAEGHLGRGGWTWYSGSGGWLYRALLEWQLGLRVEGDTLRIQPCIPRTWPGYRMRLQHGKSSYAIRVENPRHGNGNVVSIEVDGVAQAAPHAVVPLLDDGKQHDVRVELG